MAAGATYEPIATTTLASAQATITFSSIPSTYTDLRVVIAGSSASGTGAIIQFNGDTATNYSTTRLYGDGTSAVSSRQTSVANPNIGDFINAQPSLSSIDVFSYAGSTYKTYLCSNSADANGSGTVAAIVGLWRSTAAINSIALKNNSSVNWNSGTTATLYGVKAA